MRHEVLPVLRLLLLLLLLRELLRGVRSVRGMLRGVVRGGRVRSERVQGVRGEGVAAGYQTGGEAIQLARGETGKQTNILETTATK